MLINSFDLMPSSYATDLPDWDQKALVGRDWY